MSDNTTTAKKKIGAKIGRLIDYCKEKYEWLLALVLKSNHVQVNKEKYIRQLVKRFYAKSSPEEQQALTARAVEGSPLDILTEQQVNKAYSKLRRHYGWIVFCVSFLTTTVPDNMWVIIISCAIDLYIFQCMQFRAMQKIMMLYGQPIDLNENENEGVEQILEIDRSGLMLGKYPILHRLKSGMGILAKQVVQKQGPKLVSKMSKSAFMVIRRQCIKWFSVVVAKQQVSLMFDLLIPLTCAIISGLVSVFLLVPMCNNLRKEILGKIKAQE